MSIKVVLDTNVFLSGVFFAGTPGRVLDACFSKDVEVIVSPEILAEYQAAGHVSPITSNRVNLDVMAGRCPSERRVCPAAAPAVDVGHLQG